MKVKITLISISLLLAISCTSPQSVEDKDLSNPPTAFPKTETPSETDGGATSLQLPTPIVGTVALDFSERPCSASWSNNGEYLPCPGNLDAINGGYADRFDQIVIEGNIHIDQPGLLTIPAQKGSGFYAIFGKYPPFTVQTGDHFQAVLTCANNHPNCDVDFSLEFYKSDNNVQLVSGAKWNKKYDSEGSYIYADVSLDSLAGRTVQFLLTVRDNGDAEDDYAVWIMPNIARLSAGTDAVPSGQVNNKPTDLVNVSGKVDMSSAPPYLYDDHRPGSLSSVVLFDLNSAMFYTKSTQPDDLSFSLNVPAGTYHALAYSYGVGDVPYVTGAYTGSDPSCGQIMAAITVTSGTPVSGLLINDWNWSCGGTAERTEKPEEVSLP